jgi:tRNA U34 5-methylaminomethyl-2-thiouridine-forming methyltransferase MnmC
MATLEQLREKKRELEEKLYAGDLSVEPALEHVDNAIASRTRTIQHSQKRLAAVKEAVNRGVSVEEAKAGKPKSAARKKAEARAKKPVNRF